jgi:hypothetical protein
MITVVSTRHYTRWQALQKSFLAVVGGEAQRDWIAASSSCVRACRQVLQQPSFGLAAAEFNGRIHELLIDGIGCIHWIVVLLLQGAEAAACKMEFSTGMQLSSGDGGGGGGMRQRRQRPAAEWCKGSGAGRGGEGAEACS